MSDNDKLIANLIMVITICLAGTVSFCVHSCYSRDVSLGYHEERCHPFSKTVHDETDITCPPGTTLITNRLPLNPGSNLQWIIYTCQCPTEVNVDAGGPINKTMPEPSPWIDAGKDIVP